MAKPDPIEQAEWEKILRKEGLGMGKGRRSRDVLSGDAAETRATTADAQSRADFEEDQREADRFDRRHRAED